MSYSRHISLVLTLVFTASLTAQQTKVVPAAAAKRDGNKSTPYFAGFSAGRVQQITMGSSLCQKTAVLSEVALRHDAASKGVISGMDFAKLIFSVGYASKTPATMSSKFATNRSASGLVLVYQGRYSLPKQPLGLRPFNIPFKFPNAFVYTRSKGDLLMEWEIPALARRVDYFFDAERSSGFQGSSKVYGAGGAFKSGDAYRITCNDVMSLLPGGSVKVMVWGLKKAYPAWLVTGFSDKKYGALGLPFHLSGLGAPGNYLNASLDLLTPLPLKFGKVGYEGRSVLPVPNDLTLFGIQVYSQPIYADPASNSLGLVFGHGLSMQFISGGQEQQLLAHQDYKRPLGYLGNGDGLVIRFTGVFR